MLNSIQSVLIANRGEVSVRIARAAEELGLNTVAVYSEDDRDSLHVRAASSAHALRGCGPSPYLDMDAMIEAARLHGCGAVHPGYGFLSENAAFSRRCADAGLVFVGPRAETLDLFGDKARARALAQSLSVPVLPGSGAAIGLEQARAFLHSCLSAGASMMIKAVAGGGGRGMRRVTADEELEEAFQRCQSEARAAFGSSDLYVERLLAGARHIEVQAIGDGEDCAILGDRDCSVQRRHQKVIEIAPSPSLSDALRAQLADASLRMARAVRLDNVATFEFLLKEEGGEHGFWFIEANPRLQVEHTVTEQVTGVDLVKSQLRLALGASLPALGIARDGIPTVRGHAVQLRINMELLASDQAAGGVLEAFDLPSGPGVRVDTFAYAGFAPSRNFDALLAKLVVHEASGSLDAVLRRAYRALCEFRIAGVPTNLPLLQHLICLSQLRDSSISTDFLDRQLAQTPQPASTHRQLFFPAVQGLAAAQAQAAGVVDMDVDDGDVPVRLPMGGTVVEVNVAPGAPVQRGQQVAVVQAMKMEHAISAPCAGTVTAVAGGKGDFLPPRHVLVRIAAGADDGVHASTEVPDAGPRTDLEEVRALHALTLDAARPEAVRRRHAIGKRTARENLADLCDPESFLEYGALAVAAQRARHPIEELRASSPADGFLYGTASVNGALFGAEAARCMVASYDYTVFVGTQGHLSHAKHDRMIRLAESGRLPVVLFAEGAGGRPNDTDKPSCVNLANPTFWLFARLSGLVPLIGIAAGRCFAGNVALLGCCDLVIATEDATLGMAGPVMIRYAGLGLVRPEEIGPAPRQAQCGVVDLLVRDEREAVAMAKKYLGYFQGRVGVWTCAEQAALRDAVPQRRSRAYEIRRVISTLADTDSVLELRAGFARGMVTALARVEGRAIGIVANDPAHHAGAIGADEADKFARFVQLCDAFDIPILSLCDTPGIMVGPDAECQALVRHAARMLVVGANISVPYFTVALRKAYGLGAMAMGGGSFHASFFAVAWPTAEFGAMGLEGQVSWGHAAELDAIADPAERAARFEQLVNSLYEQGKATNIAPFLSIDDVIDPAQTRVWIVRGLAAAGPSAPRTGKKRPCVDAW